ncbi:p23 chaperone protein wos2 [Lecanora helva]
MSESSKTTPEVTWAQRSSTTDAERNYVYLTIAAPDVPDKSFKVDLKPNSLTFNGHSETKKTTYHVELEFYAEIDPENSKTHHTSRDVEFVLRKKELKAEYWPRLLKESAKVHFLKTNFDKWVDEDEQDAAPEDDMAGMGGMGGGMPGMPGMGDMGGKDGFGGIDFSKLGGGAGGMPDMSNLGGMGGEEDEGDDEGDDEEMPELEEEEGAEAEGKGKGKEGAGEAEGKAKIEEVA